MSSKIIAFDQSTERKQFHTRLGYWAIIWQRFRRNRVALAGLFVVTAWALVAATIPILARASPTRQDLSSFLIRPSRNHLLGTDSFGRDVLARTLYGARVSLVVASAAVLAAIALGVPSGLLAGYLGGALDSLLMRVMDGFLSFPPILLAIVLVGSFGPTKWNVVTAISIAMLPVFARLARSSALSIKSEEYVTAAQAMGASRSRILFKHILPNITSPIIAQVAVSAATAIIAEAALGYLGLGVQPPTPSWGLDLREGQRWLEQSAWVAVGPAAAISSTVWSVNVLADGLRDALDPRAMVRVR